jgi:hypothetical protein
MIKAFLFALLFIVIGAVAFAFLAPLLFHGADMRRFGASMRIPTHFGQQSDFNRTVIRFNSDSRPI